MQFIFSTPVLIRYLWQLKIVVFLHWCLICAVLFKSDHKDKSGASFCCKMTALVTYIFCKFHILKNHKIAKNSTTTEAREYISTYLESLKFQKSFVVCMTKLKRNKILYNKRSHLFQVTTKQYTGWAIPIGGIRFANTSQNN